MSDRNYPQYCGIAYGLDIVGERWTLLIIRELMAGPRRFKDLLDGLPEISTNLLSSRLKRLEQHGVLGRRLLPPPAASTVYELTPLGQALERTLLELGKWGSQLAPPTPEDVTVLRLGSYALTPKTFFRSERAQGVSAVYEWHVDGETLQMQFQAGEMHVQQGSILKPDAVFHTDVLTYLGLLRGQLQTDEAVSQGRIQIEGDPAALHQFLYMCGVPDGHEETTAPA